MFPLGGSACWNAEEKCSWQERTSWFVALNVFQVLSGSILSKQVLL